MTTYLNLQERLQREHLVCRFQREGLRGGDDYTLPQVRQGRRGHEAEAHQAARREQNRHRTDEVGIDSPEGLGRRPQARYRQFVFASRRPTFDVFVKV